MIEAKAVKSTALATLKDNWAWAIAVCMVPICATFCINIVFNLLYGVMGLVSYILCAVFFMLCVSPLILGSIRMFWRLAYKEKDNLLSLFYYYESKQSYLKALSFSLRFALKIAISCVVFLILPAAVYAVSSGWIFTVFGAEIPAFANYMGLLVNLLFLCAVFLIIVRFVNLYLTIFLFVADESLSPKQCMIKGVHIGRLTKGMFSVHIFAFSGWIILSLFIVPLPFTLPYLLMSYVVDCRYSVAYYNRFVNEQKSTVYEA